MTDISFSCSACSRIGVLQPAEVGLRNGQCDENNLKNVVDITGGPGDNEQCECSKQNSNEAKRSAVPFP
jgi:hypothetical protein